MDTEIALSDIYIRIMKGEITDQAEIDKYHQRITKMREPILKKINREADKVLMTSFMECLDNDGFFEPQDGKAIDPYFSISTQTIDLTFKPSSSDAVPEIPETSQDHK